MFGAMAPPGGFAGRKAATCLTGWTLQNGLPLTLLVVGQGGRKEYTSCNKDEELLCKKANDIRDNF